MVSSVLLYNYKQQLPIIVTFDTVRRVGIWEIMVKFCFRSMICQFHYDMPALVDGACP